MHLPCMSQLTMQLFVPSLKQGEVGKNNDIEFIPIICDLVSKIAADGEINFQVISDSR